MRYALCSFTDQIPSYKRRCLPINLKTVDIRRTILSLASPSLLEKFQYQRSLRNRAIFWLGTVRTNYALNAPISRTFR